MLDSLVQEGRPICYGVLKPGNEDPDGVPLVRIVDIEHNEVDLHNFFRISKRLDEEFRRSRLNGGELLVSIQGTIGRVAVAPKEIADANISRTIARVAIGHRADTRYIRYWLMSDMGQTTLRDSVLGTTRDSLNIGALRQIQLFLPPIREQRRIADILDVADEAIRQTERLIAKLKLVKAGLLHDLLTGGLDEHGRLRDPQAHPEQFKDSPVGRIPRKWQVLTLDDITLDDAPICYGIVQPGPYTRSGVPVLAIYNLDGDYSTNIHRSAKNIEEKYIRSRVRSGDVLLSVKGTTGRVGIVPSWFEGNISRDIARIRLKSLASPSFIRHMLEAPRTRYRLGLATVGTTRAEISIWILKQFRLPVPSLDEQVRIADELDTYDTRVRAEEAALEKFRQVKRGLMDDLLIGRVRVTA